MALLYGRAGRLTAKNGGSRPGQSFATLISDCKKYSSKTLTLFAGYSIETNIGDHYFVYGPLPELPPPMIIDSSSRLLIQPVGPKNTSRYVGFECA